MNYGTRALKIIQNEGVVELSKMTKNHFKLTLKKELSPFNQWWRYGRYYDVELNASRHFWINPDEIYFPSWWPKINWHIINIVEGDWDQKKIPFETNPFPNQQDLDTNVLYNSLNEYLTSNVHYDNLELFEKVINGETYWRDIETREEFQNRLKYCQELYNKMKDEGYKTYQQRNNNRDKPKYPEEIKIMVGRDGDFFYRDGKHRLSIAKIIGLNEVAVNVVAYHKEWQELREEIHNNGLSMDRKHLCDHPDLQDILD